MTPDVSKRNDTNTTFSLIQDKIFRDQVTFDVTSNGSHGEMSLKVFSSNLELNFIPYTADINRVPVEIVCCSIRQILEESVSRSLSDLHYSSVKLKPETCFKCDRCSELHPTTKVGEFYMLSCSSTKRSSRLPLQGRCWYGEGTSEDSGSTTTGNIDEAHQPVVHTQTFLHLGSQSLPSPEEAPLATPPDVHVGAIGQQLQSPELKGITSRGDFKVMLATADSSPLDLDDDLGDVVDAVEPLASKWRRLSTKLRLKESTLAVIEHENPGDVVACLHKALGEWLRLNYDHQRHGRPSWRRLAEAVSSLDYALSENIAMMHPEN